MARNWKKMSKEEEDKKRQETIDKAVEMEIQEMEI